MTRFATIVVLFLSYTTVQAQDWVITSVAAGMKPALDVDSQGNPHLSYVSQSPTGWVRYAAWNPLTMEFDTAEVSPGNLEGPTAIGLDQNDVPHIVYHRHDQPPDQVHAYPSGPVWVSEDITDPNHDGWDNSIAFDSNNLPHTSSIDPSSYPGSTGVEYAWYDGVAWHVEPIGSTLVDFFGGTSIAVDSADNPHITYYDDITDDLMYAVRENNVWTIVPIETDGDAGRFSSLELDLQGYPVVGYYKHLSGNMGVVRLAWFNGSLWDFTTVDTLAQVNVLGARSAVSLALDGENEPHLGYGDQKVVKYAHRTGTTWEAETVVDHSMAATVLGHVTSLDLGILDQPHIVYYEAGGIGAVKHATKLVTSDVGSEPTYALDFALMQNYPNPFNGETVFRLQIADYGLVSLAVFDLLGQHVATIVSEYLVPGTHTRRWDATGLPSGVYFYRLQAGTFTATRRLILLL